MEKTVKGLSVGSVLITSWFATALSGIVLLQAYFYYRSKPKNDLKIFTILIVVLLLLDSAHIVCIMITIYHYLIENFGNNDALGELVPSLALTVGLTGTITFFAQSFFTWRVWKLSRKNIIAPITFLLQIARLTLGWVTTARAIHYGTFDDWATKVRWLFTTGVSVAVACDILITGGLCYWLHGSRTGLSSMDEAIDKLILYSVENGLLTCVFSIASLVCAIIMPGNLVFIGIHFVISKLYISSVLTALNTRNSFRARKDRVSMKPTLNMFSFGEGTSGSARDQNSFALHPPRHTPRGLGVITIDKTEEVHISSSKNDVTNPTESFNIVATDHGSTQNHEGAFDSVKVMAV
ncbi:hypothetical protein PNOK_0294100 [Pyrrhoderma noxium]|uniref:DUF6534 domain-containing protein n=1 Tax=Pyrrhoderma noxium TaxID=2282107 RepID=A0A286ULD7_9AGAM|nr:hypothetical protein PNOK_0294100 [Pyrrhoderma noxium]